MRKQLFRSIALFGQISSQTITVLNFHWNVVHSAKLSKDNMPFLNPGGSFLYFDFFEMLLLV
jgi:hypothetical protein